MGVYTEKSHRAVLGAGGTRIGDAAEQIAEKLGCWPTCQLVGWMGWAMQGEGRGRVEATCNDVLPASANLPDSVLAEQPVVLEFAHDRGG